MYIYEQKEIAKKIIVLNTKNVWGRTPLSARTKGKA